MDHHCVWTDRCIGYHNYKSFLLFIGYLSIGTFFYDYLAISFFLGGKTKFNILVVLVVYVETAIVFLTTFLGVSLLLAHLFMACTNLSTIEYMQGRPFRLFWKENKEAVRFI
jgi:palmitoyltransferase